LNLRHDEVAAAAQRSTGRARARNPLSGTPQQLSDLVESELARYAKIVKAANIRVE